MRFSMARRTERHVQPAPLTLMTSDTCAELLPVGDPRVVDPLADPAVSPIPDVLGDVLGAIRANGAAGGPFTTFARLMQRAEIGSLPVGLGPFTLFAPTDRAFERLGADTVETLVKEPARLARVLMHHLVPREVPAPRPGVPLTVRSVEGGELTLTVSRTTFRVNGARVVTPHIHTANGTVRGIDRVLMPR